MQSSSRTFVASANIRPSRFVRGSGNNKMAEAGANAVAYGVSGEGTVDAPIPGMTDRFAARTGQEVLVYGPGDTCEIEAGAAIDASAGPVFLKPDADGRAIPAATTQHYSAEAHTSATAAGQRVKITVVRGVMP
ncbi:MAG: hypothetical protein KF752_11750 [Pirellulaceae bacterium]|nr:hypothetical protein [Pirellulaceae bacterium]